VGCPVIDREFLRSGGLTRALAEADRLGLIRLYTPEERLRSRRETLAAGGWTGGDVWVFAYGSLMWNPAMHIAGRRPVTVHGYHRSFCLSTPIGRGTPEQPGLMLGLDRGGACRGIALRIAADQVEEELDILWSRERVAAGYLPVWVNARAGADTLPAIAFIIDRTVPTYAGKLPVEEVARRIAVASGTLGKCADYLEETVAHLVENGIHDRGLGALLARVRALRAGG